ncbi:MAG TPA: Holliday junction resolvase RuvX [Pyrinomonadaceae bacterium]
MQYSEIANEPDLSAVRPAGRIVAIDPGTKRIGVAVTDELQVVARPLPAIARKSWKKLLADVQVVIAEYDAAALVVGLPLNTDGSESSMSSEARKIAAKFALSLGIPIFLQDERVTSYEARKRLWDRGVEPEQTKQFVDSEAAVIILTDFLERLSR